MPKTRPCWDSDLPAPRKTASGPAIAKKATVAMNVTKIEVTASGSGTPERRITHIDIGADPDWNGVRYDPQAPKPPARIMCLSLTPGCTCRAHTHSRRPPPTQSMEARTRPTATQP